MSMIKSGPKRCVVRRNAISGLWLDEETLKLVEEEDKKIIAAYHAMENIPCVEPKNTAASFDRSLCYRCCRSIAECVKLRKEKLGK